MKQRNSRKNEGEFNFWQPASDMFSALLLILMLVILLLGLYLVQIPRYKLPDPEAGNTYADSDPNDVESTPTETPLIPLELGGEGGGILLGEGMDPSPSPSESPTPTPTPTPTPLPNGGGGGFGDGDDEGDGEDPNIGKKSAVFVMLVDGDTERTVKESGVQFELYGNDHALQVLNVYYPERLTFRTYETTETGTFYLPEKLLPGNYELHNLTEPSGYDPAENTFFVIDDTYDWEDPLVVMVPVFPSRNVIRVKMTDSDSGGPLSGAAFDVIAVDDVITSDGTLRYRQGETVGEILCDEHGEGTSNELYLGSYYVRQRVIPQYYVGLDKDFEATVEKKTDILPPAYPVSSPRTKIHLVLRDEYYVNRPIADATFRVTAPGSLIEPFEITTDGMGEILLNSLEKNTTYQIAQINSAQDFRIDSTTYSFTVDSSGRINGEDQGELELTNRMIRVSFGITDEFSHTQVQDVNLSLFDSSDNLVRSWTTSGDLLSFTDLAPGSYYLYRDGDTSNRFDVVIEDTAEPQVINLRTSYLMRYLIMGGAAAAALLIIVGIIVLIARHRRKKRGY